MTPQRPYTQKTRPAHLRAIVAHATDLAYDADFFLEAHGYAISPYQDDPEPNEAEADQARRRMLHSISQLRAMLEELEP